MKFVAPEIDRDDADSAERLALSLDECDTSDHITYISKVRLLAQQTLETKKD